ncbi:GNAT family protein [Nonomuraea fastidiosa]|jgi:RimJ/RimL family protein N-acetyltransferase|uniref:GNAT family N-acetyltransferase n=1 Tax=Nonomuraea TaxID=83681 RepID=UPI00324BD8CB
MFAEKPTLKGERVTLCPVGPEHAEGLFELVSDPEVRRLTGSRARFDLESLRTWYATRAGHADRLDLAITVDGAFVGEVVLNELDTDNLSCNLRIALIGARAFGKGYGSEAIELVLGHAFRTTPLHRVRLEVFDFNERARHVYEKAGFVMEGVERDALLWEGEWHDVVVMAILRPEWQARAGTLA